MRKTKTSLDLMREIRTTWVINPRTRVHDNDIRKNKKKSRNEGKKEAKKALGDGSKSFFYAIKTSIKIAAALMILAILLSAGVFTIIPVYAAAADNLVDIGKLSTDLVVDLRYATANNFTGTKLYSSSICCLQEETAWKLVRANQEVMKSGFRIKIWDAYRPLSVQKAMWKIMPDEKYLSNPYKGGSKHNKGAAVDITMVDEKGREVEMPSGFDNFTYKASRLNSKMSPTAKKNLKILTDAMVKSGFKYINSEWWHFDDADNSRYAVLDVKAEDVSKRKLAVEELQCLSGSKQVILVTPGASGPSQATLRIYENINGKWIKMAPNMQAFTGKNGFKAVKNGSLTAADKKIYKYEGDGSTPAGAFYITSLFGWGENPGLKLPYRKTTSDDYWVSGNKKEEYNVWISRKGGPSKTWTVCEKLKIPDYKYAAVINYNIGPNRIIGNGSAIFLHIADNRGYTSGCVSLSEANLLKVLKWLNPEKKPLIVQGNIQELKKLKAPQNW